MEDEDASTAFAPATTAASKTRWLARMFWRTYVGKTRPKLRTPGLPREMEDAVDAREIERILDEVDLLDRQPLRVFLLQRRVVVVGERIPADRVVAAIEERAEEVRADEPGCTGDDVAHGHGMLGEPMSSDHKYHVAEPDIREPCVDPVTPSDEAGACTQERETVGPDALDDEPALPEHRSELRLGELAMREEELGAEVALTDELEAQSTGAHSGSS